MVQLREKDCGTKEFLELALAVKSCLAGSGVPLIINDRLDIALACDADGVHLGQSDMPCVIARRLLGKDKIIGLSVENIRDVEEANGMDVDYVGISPVFSTATKSDTAPALGLEGVREISLLSRHPAVGIGGLNAGNAADVIRAGADGISVVSAIMSAADPYAAAAGLRKTIENSRAGT